MTQKCNQKNYTVSHSSLCKKTKSSDVCNAIHTKVGVLFTADSAEEGVVGVSTGPGSELINKDGAKVGMVLVLRSDHTSPDRRIRNVDPASSSKTSSSTSVPSASRTRRQEVATGNPILSFAITEQLHKLHTKIATNFKPL